MCPRRGLIEIRQGSCQETCFRKDDRPCGSRRSNLTRRASSHQGTQEGGTLPSDVCVAINERLDGLKSFRCPNGSYCSRTQIHKTELSRDARGSHVMKSSPTISIRGMSFWLAYCRLGRISCFSSAAPSRCNRRKVCSPHESLPSPRGRLACRADASSPQCEILCHPGPEILRPSPVFGGHRVRSRASPCRASAGSTS